MWIFVAFPISLISDKTRYLDITSDINQDKVINQDSVL